MERPGQNNQVADLLPNWEIENDRTELPAEHTINTYHITLLRLEAKGMSPGRPTLCGRRWVMKTVKQEFGCSAQAHFNNWRHSSEGTGSLPQVPAQRDSVITRSPSTQITEPATFGGLV